MINTTITTLKNTISNIRDTINEGIQSRIDEDPNVSDKDYLTENSPLDKYVDAIEKLKASITSTDQQIIILYTYAKDLNEANDKKIPKISWTGEHVSYEELNPFDWVPIPNEPINRDPDEKLWIRFVSIIKGSNALEGTPIQMTGDRGEKGETGEPGADAVILTQIHRLVKLYCVSPSKPQVPTFYKDTGFDLHRKFKNELDANRIYYEVGGSKIYVNDQGSNWYTSISQNNIDVWEIEVDINSKTNEIEVLSEPIIKTIIIENTKTEFAVSNNNLLPPDEGWSESRPELSIDKPYLWSKTTITFNNGIKTENISLIQELPTVIKGITTLYLATPDTKEPDGGESGWSEEIPILGPVIWKKEIVEYTSKIGGEEDSSTKITITPISIQGESGIKFIGSVESPDDLSQEALQWEDSYIGRMGVLVGKNTYIWYGTSEPVPSIEGIEKIGANYWLDLGQIHVCDWAAKEGESGYIQNRTHYVDTFKGTFGSNPGDLPANASNIKIWQDSRSWEYLYPSQINERIKDPNSPGGIFSSPFKWEDNQILSMITPGEYEYSYEITHTLDPKFIPTTIIEITYNDLKWLRDEKQLIPGRQYRITDYTTTTVQENTQSAGHQFDIIVVADDVNILNENARAIRRENDTYFSNSDLNAWELKYCLDNDTSRFAWAATNGKGVIYYMKDEHNNECPYDFKNIKFSHGDDWMYTFSVGNGAEWIDYTVIDSDELPISNTIKGNLDFSRRLYKNIFYNTDPDYFSPPIGNYIGQNSQSCTLINDCQYNVIEDRVINVELYNAYSNKIESGSSEIRIDDSVYNTIGKGCRWITIINEASAGAPDDYGRNNFLTNCHYIELKNCDYNTFGHNCHGRDEQSVLVKNCKYCHCMNGVEFINDLTNKTGQIINYPGN